MHVIISVHRLAWLVVAIAAITITVWQPAAALQGESGRNTTQGIASNGVVPIIRGHIGDARASRPEWVSIPPVDLPSSWTRSPLGARRSLCLSRFRQDRF